MAATEKRKGVVPSFTSCDLFFLGFGLWVMRGARPCEFSQCFHDSFSEIAQAGQGLLLHSPGGHWQLSLQVRLRGDNRTRSLQSERLPWHEVYVLANVTYHHAQQEQRFNEILGNGASPGTATVTTCTRILQT